jgi:hypothetical protein
VDLLTAKLFYRPQTSNKWDLDLSLHIRPHTHHSLKDEFSINITLAPVILDQ